MKDQPFLASDYCFRLYKQRRNDRNRHEIKAESLSRTGLQGLCADSATLEYSKINPFYQQFVSFQDREQLKMKETIGSFSAIGKSSMKHLVKAVIFDIIAKSDGYTL